MKPIDICLKDSDIVSYAEHLGGRQTADSNNRHNVTGIQCLMLDFPPILVTLLRDRKGLEIYTEGHVSKTILSFSDSDAASRKQITHIPAETQLDQYLST